jgi:hypothetical protein
VRWFTVNGTTIAMALVLSLLTIGLLTKPDPGEEVEPLRLNARFLPDVKAQVGSLEFWVGDKRYTDTIPVTVSGDQAQVSVISSLTCQPLLDQSKFPDDPAIRETTVEISHKDFNLPSDLASRILIKPFYLRITYAPMVTKMLPVEVSLLDIEDAKDNTRFRVDAVRAMPSPIKVRLPVDKALTLKSLPIKPIRIQGRNRSFEIEGQINTDLPDLKDVRKQEPFWIGVDLVPIPFRAELGGVKLFLSCAPVPGYKADLIDRMDFKVVLEGPQDLVEKVRPEQLHVYVKLDLTPDSQPGTYTLPVRCDVADESLRKFVRVYLAPGESVMAAVQVIKG